MITRFARRPGYKTAMRKRVQIALTILLARVLVVLAFRTLRQSEPIYQGKPLSVWLQGNQPDEEQEVYEAIRGTGTNAIPSLSRMLRAHDPPLKLKLFELVQKLPVVWLKPTLATTWNVRGERGFHALGEDAKDAVPELIRIYEANVSASSQSAAANALGSIGSDAAKAVPSLLGRMTDTNASVRGDAAYTLGRIHSKPELVLPPLLKSLDDSNAEVRYHAAVALGRFRAAAKAAVPALVCLLHTGEQWGVRNAASQALKVIAPDAAESESVK
jgi:hypothetical protein